jgi:hypothetical protein
VPHNARYHNQINARKPQAADQGVAEIMPAPDANSDSCCVTGRCPCRPEYRHETGISAGQIASRELEIVRIQGALQRAEELSDDVAAAIEGVL